MKVSNRSIGLHLQLKRTLTGAIVVLLLTFSCGVAPVAGASKHAGNNAVASVNAAAKNFLQLLVLNPNEMLHDGLRFRPQMVQVAKLYAAKHYRQALNAFYSYYLNKFAAPQHYGLPTSLSSPYLSWGAPPFWIVPPMFDPATKSKAIVSTANQLRKGIMNLGGQQVHIGAPGTVNWNYPFPAGRRVPAMLAHPNLHHWQVNPNPMLITLGGFNPLVQAYILTHKPVYLKTWVAYLADWCRNSHYLGQLNPLFVPDGVNAQASSMPMNFMRLLEAIRSVNPDIQRYVPPALFATALRKMYLQSLLPGVAYIRSNTHNWTPASSGSLINPIVFDEFRGSAILFRNISRRSIENVESTEELRDGSETQEDPWYDKQDFVNIWWMIRLLNSRRLLVPTWQMISWENQLSDNTFFRQDVQRLLYRKNTFLTHIQTPQGQWPITFRGDQRRAGAMPYPYSPQAWNNPVNAAIMKAIYNPGSGIVPPYTSDWFPYIGLAIMRDGWKPTSCYGALFCSPQPPGYGAFRGRSDNNSFGLAAYGQDLLVNDTTGHYMYPTSPMKVNGFNQFFEAGIYKVASPEAHKGYEVSAWHKPAPWLWYASPTFNLAEGIYAGRWGSLHHPRTVAGPYGPDQSMQGTLTKAQTYGGLTFQRQVMQVRRAKLFIITDRLLSKKSNRYTQIWRFPVAPTPTSFPTAFKPADIHINPAARSIITDQPNGINKPYPKSRPIVIPKANLQLFQFSQAPLAYSSKLIKEPPMVWKTRKFYIHPNLDRIAVKWHGQGNQQIVTAILVLPPGSTRGLQQIHQITSGKQAVGFAAALPDGVPVAYLASPMTDDFLSLPHISIHGQALLLAGHHGMALGCSTLFIHGKTSRPAYRNFAFRLSGGLLSDVHPIHRPIVPVKILPNTTAFVGHMKVTLSTPTPGVIIRYTTNGANPTPLSKVYTAPFIIDHTSKVQTRAYRLGVKSNPITACGTAVTPTTEAIFHKIAVLPALPAWRERLVKPGLDCQYYQAPWQSLWLNLENLTPQKTGVVNKLWDMDFIPASNPPVRSAAAPRQHYYALVYSGYLNVPSTGVYTFHAPKEYDVPSTDPGYQLRVYVGQNSNSPSGLNQWDTSERVHAFGNWSIALSKGLQPFKIVYVDYRKDSPEKLNRPGLNDYIWAGVAPKLEISGPKLKKEPIPQAWLRH